MSNTCSDDEVEEGQIASNNEGHGLNDNSFASGRDDRPRLREHDSQEILVVPASDYSLGTAGHSNVQEQQVSAASPSTSSSLDTRPGAVAVAAPAADEASKLRLGTFGVRTPSDRALGDVEDAGVAGVPLDMVNYKAGRTATIAMPDHEEVRATEPGAVAVEGDDKKQTTEEKPTVSGGGMRRESRPGAVLVAGAEDDGLPSSSAQFDSSHLYQTDIDDPAPHIVAHLVTNDEEAARSAVPHNQSVSSPTHVDDAMPVAVAKKDSFWSLLRHDRRTQIIAAVFIIAIVGLGVGLGVTLSKSNDGDTNNSSGPDETYLQAGSSIDGPDKFFEYGSGEASKFGKAVAISGDGKFIVVGAPKFKGSVNGEESVDLGLVQLFEEKDGDWMLMEPSILGEAAGDQTGSSVCLSLDSTTVAVGSPGFSSNKGQVKVLQRNESDGAWVPLGTALIGETEGDELGTSVAISEDGRRVVVGMLSSTESGDDSERAKVFEFDSESGDLMQLGQDLEGRSGGNPISMSADGTTVAMGSLSTAANDFVAGIRVYEYGSSGNWTVRGSDIVLQGAEGSYDTGWSTSMSKDGMTVAIGSSVENAQKSEDYDLKVLAYRFDEEDGDWVQQGETQHDLSGDHLIAYRVALSADAKVLAIGDPGGFAMGIKSGHTHVLRWQNEEWFHITKELEGTNAADLFGDSLALTADGNRVCIGAPQSRATGTELGRVQIFELANL